MNNLLLFTTIKTSHFIVFSEIKIQCFYFLNSDNISYSSTHMIRMIHKLWKSLLQGVTWIVLVTRFDHRCTSILYTSINGYDINYGKSACPSQTCGMFSPGEFKQKILCFGQMLFFPQRCTRCFHKFLRV